MRMSLKQFFKDRDPSELIDYDQVRHFMERNGYEVLSSIFFSVMKDFCGGSRTEEVIS